MAIVAVLAAVAALAVVPAADAKEFRPGDLLLCGAERCVTIRNDALLDRLSAFVYTGSQPAATKRVTLGAAYFELRFRNGYVAGIFATRRLDRWLSYGVIYPRFVRGTWYGVSPATAAGLRSVARCLAPMRLTRAAVARSR